MLILSHLFLGQRTCISSLGPILRPYYRRWCLRPISRHVGFHPVKDAGERLRFSLSLILNGKIIFLEVRVIGKSSRSIIGGYIYFYLPFNRTNTPLASTTTRMCSDFALLLLLLLHVVGRGQLEANSDVFESLLALELAWGAYAWQLLCCDTSYIGSHLGHFYS